MTTINDFSLELNDYIKTRYKYKNTGIHINVPNIGIRRKRVDLYIRYNVEWRKMKNVLVIARIEFQKQRKGEGRYFLNFICEQAKKHNFEYIGIETAGVKAIAFGKKFGFTVIEPNNPIIEMNARDLIIKLSTLKKQLNIKIVNTSQIT